MKVRGKEKRQNARSPSLRRSKCLHGMTTHLSWDNESCGVGSEVEEELQEYEDWENVTLVSFDLIEESSQETEEKSVHGETEKLDWLTSDDLDETDGEEVTW